MIRTLHRTRGASAVGARHPGETGPFGVRPDVDDGQDDEPDDQDHDDRASVRRTDGSATPTGGAATAGFNVTPANTTTEGAAP